MKVSELLAARLPCSNSQRGRTKTKTKITKNHRTVHTTFFLFHQVLVRVVLKIVTIIAPENIKPFWSVRVQGRKNRRSIILNLVVHCDTVRYVVLQQTCTIQPSLVEDKAEDKTEDKTKEGCSISIEA